MRRLVAVLAVGLAFVSPAAGHGPAGGGQGYVSTVAGLEPNVLGVFVSVLGGDDRLRLVNYSGKTIDVLGYKGEPFLRFGKDGVYQNLRSPATYLSSVRDPAKAQLPASADPKAAPRWQQVAAAGESFVWHDHRIHWTEAEPPRIVQEAPDEIHLHLPLAHPGSRRREAIRRSRASSATRRRRSTADDDGISAWLLAALIGVTVLVAVASERGPAASGGGLPSSGRLRRARRAVVARARVRVGAVHPVLDRRA